MKKAFLVIALLAAVPSMSLADDAVFDDALFDEEAVDGPLKTSVHLYPFAEKIKWREFFQGAQALEEKGDRRGAGAMATFESGPSVYRLKGEYFEGTGDVQGGDGLFSWATEVREYGFKLEGDGGWRIPIGRASIVPNLGLGYRWWRRDYENSATVDGWLERWHTVYFKLGALAEYDIGGGGGIVPYAEAAVRIGIFNNNEMDYNGTVISTNPGGRITPYAEAGLKLSLLKAAVYYERIEFAESDPVPAPGLPPGYGLVQMEVKANIYGARVGVSF